MSFIYCCLFYIFSIFFKLNGDYIIFEGAFKSIANRNFWYTNNIAFASQNEFFEEISKTYPELVGKLVYVNVTGEFDESGEFIQNDSETIYKVCIPPPLVKPKPRANLKRVKFSSDEVTIRHSLNGKTTYECDGRVVPTLQKLAECALKKRQQMYGPTCQRMSYRVEPSVCTNNEYKKRMSNSKLFCESIDVVQLLNYQNSLKKSTFSDKIWSSIWKNRYSYGCFSQYNYRLLRERYMREINAYRSSHKASPLTEDLKLTQIAQARALKLAYYKKLSPDPNTDYEEIIGSVRLFTAPLLIKSWYDSMFKYKLRYPSFTRKSQNFIKMIWKNTTYLGIGIVKSYCHLIVVIKFPQREKKFTKYIYNVKQRVKN
uniref:SCP domain-containing protein n=1 Tax=Strongyloides papillosus TaxID=174720 RepID=A0A0N5BV75_STREA